MFNWFKKKKVEEKEEPKNLQLISLCLAFEVAASDYDIDLKEKELILNKIKENIDTDVFSSDEVFEIIKNENEAKVSFYDLIYEMNKNLAKDEKEEVIEEAKQISDVKDVIASILLVENLRIKKN